MGAEAELGAGKATAGRAGMGAPPRICTGVVGAAAVIYLSTERA